MHFRYTVQEEDNDPDGVEVAAEGVTLNGGAIVDAAGNAANLSLTAVSIDLSVRIVIVQIDDDGVVTLSTRQPLVGEAMTAALADHDGVQAGSAAWQWWRRKEPDGEWRAVAGATGSSYVPAPADGTHRLQARVGYRDGYGAQTAASAQTQAVDLHPARRERMLQVGLAGVGRTVAATAVGVIGERLSAAMRVAGDSEAIDLDLTLNGRPLALPVTGGVAARSAAVIGAAEALGVRVQADGSGGCGRYRPVDGGWGRGRQPVINVSWDDAQAYVAWLARRTGADYRLLTEAEWEYAARAGTTTPFHTGVTITTDHANYDGGRPIAAGSLARNAFGLYDVHGNVAEMVADCYDGSGSGCNRRVVRGGSWGSPPRLVRSAYRSWCAPTLRSPHNGFRVAREL